MNISFKPDILNAFTEMIRSFDGISNPTDSRDAHLEKHAELTISIFSGRKIECKPHQENS
jgi:hypothetical protein